jgi:hypothetical protein
MKERKKNVTAARLRPEMSIAAEKLPLPRRDVSKKQLPRRCRDTTAYKNILPRMYWTRNIGTRPSDSFGLRVFHL